VCGRPLRRAACDAVGGLIPGGGGWLRGLDSGASVWFGDLHGRVAGGASVVFGVVDSVCSTAITV
jgi:hypothetical protein